MRVTFASALDNFSCQRVECLCARVRTSPLVAGHPGRAGVLAALQPSGQGPAALPWNDFPLQAVQSPDGVSLAFCSLCPAVRAQLVAGEEPVTAAQSEGGWRQPLRVWQPDGAPQVRLFADCPVPWPEFVTFRDVLLDLAAEPELPVLGRLTRIAMTMDAAQHARTLPPTAPTLTPRGFLAFRAFVESRCAAVDANQLEHFARDAAPMFPELALGPAELAALREALTGDWREQVRRWLVPAERDLLQVFETVLGVRLLALPFDRDVTLARAWAELLESTALAIRYAAALAVVRQAPTDTQTLAAALALAEHFVATSEQPLVVFAPQRDVHDRGPRMADLDLSLESIC